MLIGVCLLLVQEHRSFPSIVQWVVFNEGWGQHDTFQVVQYAQSLDASRLFDPASGWVDSEVGNIHILHCAASNCILAVLSRGLRIATRSSRSFDIPWKQRPKLKLREYTRGMMDLHEQESPDEGYIPGRVSPLCVYAYWRCEDMRQYVGLTRRCQH